MDIVDIAQETIERMPMHRAKLCTCRKPGCNARLTSEEEIQTGVCDNCYFEEES